MVRPQRFAAALRAEASGASAGKADRRQAGFADAGRTDILAGDREHRLLVEIPGLHVVAWGDNPVSSGRSYSRAKGPGASAGACPMARREKRWRDGE